MEELLRFLQLNEGFIYLVLGIGGMLYLRNLWQSWQEWRGTVFGLERENAQRRFSGAVTVLSLLLLLGLAEFSLVTFVAPSYPANRLLPTPTLNKLSTPTPKLLMTLLPTSQGTRAPTAQATLSQDCQPGKIELSSPKSGDEVKGTIQLKGTVNIPNLGFYKYEYSPVGSEVWITIAADNKVKNKEVLGVWNTTQVAPGDYRIRIVATDSLNLSLPACVVIVRVKTPE
jgi:hypothetical protein